MSRKIYVVGSSTDYASWMEGVLVPSIEDADLVVFTGGTDVDPALYGELPHPMTQRPDKLRDKFEVATFEEAKSLGKKMVGICRGAQFLCVMAGGKLIQHQENKGQHLMYNIFGPPIKVSSDHHQSQYPWILPRRDYLLPTRDDFKLLGWTEGISSFHEGENGIEVLPPLTPDLFTEVEDAYYPKIDALAIQSHPEWLDPYSESVRYHRKLLTMFMKGEL
jgi:hypothetical protein